jgi:hypothetical protein
MSDLYTIWNWGLGVNSTAGVIESVQREDRVDLVLSADTGDEKPETYDFRGTFTEWLKARGVAVEVAHKTPVKARVNGRKVPVAPGTTYSTLEQNCLVNKTLPSVVFGYKSCSQKWKREPMDAFLRGHAPVVAEWEAGRRVARLIGYDAGEPQRPANMRDTAREVFRFPLIEWGWYREQCIAVIVGAGLPVPPKSACFYCPSSKKSEIIQLSKRHPDLYKRALAMEDNARENLGTVVGLGRHFSWRDVEGTNAPDPADAPCGCFDESEDAA